MSTGVLLAVSGTAAASFALLSGELGRRVRRIRCRLESLDRPLHELRGALAALELGLSFVERSPEVQRELNGCADSLHVSLDRAALAARDISILHVGGAAVIDVKVELDLRELVLRSARAWSFLSSSYAGSVEVDWRAGPVRVLGHSTRLQQALDNLIANALEHGGSRVLIEGECREQTVRVLVSDGGGGLPQDLGDVLAEKEAETASVSKSGSLRGHGLAIASEVIRDHRGRLGLGMGSNGPGLLVELPMSEDLQQGRPAGTARDLRSANGRAAQAA
jgi:signal transduction histidine kinase